MNKKSVFLTLPMLMLLLLATISCHDDGNADENFSESFSGTFNSGPMSTDTNDDGSPASIAELQGDSTFGPINIKSINEFMLIEPTGACPPGDLEFTLVRGNFIKRFAETGELLFGTWNSGTSCFDPVTTNSETTQNGEFSGGTGQFANTTGPIQITFSSTDLATTVEEGFRFGGTAGTGTGILE
jgi:hypothetical protein